MPIRADYLEIELADGQALPISFLEDQLLTALACVCNRNITGYRPIQRKTRKVESTGNGGQPAQSDRRMDERLQKIIFCLRFGLGGARNRQDARQNLQRIGMPPIFTI